MIFGTHQVLGLTFGLGFMLLSGDKSVAPLVSVSVGSWLPDMDQPQKYFWPKPVAFIFSKLLGHRSVLDSCLVMFLCFLLALGGFWYFKWPWYLTLYFLLGYSLHLLGDFLTIRGIPFFWPFNNHYFSASWFKTGSFKERYFALGLGLVLLLELFFFVKPVIFKFLEVIGRFH